MMSMKKILLGLFLLLAVAGRVEGATIYVNTDNTGTENGTTKATGYKTLATLEATNATLTENTTIECYGATADTASCTFSGWTLGAYSLTIQGDWIPTSTGSLWDTSKYRLQVTTWGANGLTLQSGNIIVKNLQISATSGSSSGIGLQTAAGNTIQNCLLYNCKEHGAVIVGSGTKGIGLVAYSCTGNGISVGTDAYLYQSTAAKNGGAGIARYSGEGYFYNCLGVGNTGRDMPAVDASAHVAYCASEDDTADDNGGTGNRASQTFTFLDYDNNNYHLDSADAGAKGYGNDYSGVYTIDFDGTTISSWSIGADGQQGVPGSSPLVVTKIILGE